MLKSLEKPIVRSDKMRFIGRLEGKEKGPTLIFFGGIHGNEPAGVQALEEVFRQLRHSAHPLKGSVYGIRGNIPALFKKVRYLDQDLNRLWSTPSITQVEKKAHGELRSEERELLEIKQTLAVLLKVSTPPFYFIDFHTTSSKTPPFITINDALINRKFSKQFPVPIILGIEEYLEGPLLSRMNQLGYVSLGFESGQHHALAAVKNSMSFFWLTLVFAGVLEKGDVPDFEWQYRRLQTAASGHDRFYEVVYRHALRPADEFRMFEGFRSFQKIARGTVLAIQNKEEIRAEIDSMLFMPLYQSQGADGFFLIRRTPQWALRLSTWFRKSRSDNLLTLLPGISWQNARKESLLVNRSIARFFTKSFFHLLGYRNREISKNQWLMHNRERTAKNVMYRREPWY